MDVSVWRQLFFFDVEKNGSQASFETYNCMDHPNISQFKMTMAIHGTYTVKPH